MATGGSNTNPNPTTNQTTNPTTNPTTTEVRRTISPYDLTAADNSRAVISHPLLMGMNYDEWACGMKTALCSRKKFGFLDGTMAKPEEGSPDLEDWWTIQALLVSWIKISIDPKLRSNISHRDVAKELWDHLKKRFSVTNGPRIQQIKAELACCRQRGLAIETYFGKLTRIWDSMANYRPLRLCKCGKCECDLGELQEKDREEDKMHQFLFGLDDTLFQTVRSSLVSRIPIQPMEEVYNIVRQEEDLMRNETKGAEENQEVSAFAVQTAQPFRRDNVSRTMFCKHCNRSGHSIDSCYGVIGYPEWWGDRPRSRTTSGRGRGRGGTSGMVGRGRGITSYANAVHVNLPAGYEQANYVVTDKDRDGVSGLSDSQWKAIKSLLNAGKTQATEKLTGTSFSHFWIMDTGASHHMTDRLDILTDVKGILPVGVMLADGRESVAVKEGSVRLGPNLILHSVYYIEDFQKDLISLCQLMDENHCVVQLADHFLVVQDRTTRMVTGVSKCMGRTFYFRSMELAASMMVRDVKSLELWYKRMRHPSSKVVGLFPIVSYIVASKISNKACDICLSAKQIKLSFQTI